MSKISYPRKCNDCDYVSNNPSMYHYHRKIHATIPNGTMCWQGCGNQAKFLNTHGKYTCCKIVQQCSEYRKKHANRIAEHWVDAADRKERTKKSFVERLHNRATVERAKETKRQKSGLLTPELARDYRHYARAIRQQAQRWAKSQGYVLGQQTYHVDHKFSILDSWNAKLPAKIVNHPYNLRILEAKANSSKSSKSIISIEELLVAVNQDVAQV